MISSMTSATAIRWSSLSTGSEITALILIQIGIYGFASLSIFEFFSFEIFYVCSFVNFERCSFCGSNLLCEKNLLTLCRESHVHRICHFISTSVLKLYRPCYGTRIATFKIQSHGAAGYATATTTGDSIQSWQIVLKLGSLHWLFW
ncbi:uncharacterized protein DS421_19g640680 [Arachis hypogaea]|uniref:Uncharacterized protein n=1 Tax=Arachis hypogaea TaxID=3818 RepID=A0A6B9V3R5_ARAHY|nr:uncharacterized protein DS421_19g640680 [Arachis hypogaea]